MKRRNGNLVAPRLGSSPFQPGSHLLTFGEGGLRWRRAAERLGRQAVTSGLFSNVVVWNGDDVLAADNLFFAQRHSLFHSRNRGWGYWCWKPFMIRWYLENSNSAANRIFFLDAGFHVNSTSAAQERFRSYEQHVDANNMLVMRNQSIVEREWTKPAVFNRLQISELDRLTQQVAGGLVGVKAAEMGIALVKEWEALTLEDDGSLLLEPSGAADVGRYLKAHRHDQSLLSCLSKARGVPPLDDESYFAPDWKRAGADFPFWAVRNRSGVNFHPSWPIYRSKKLLDKLYTSGYDVIFGRGTNKFHMSEL